MTDGRALLVFFSSPRSGPSRRMESLLAHIGRKQRERVRVLQVELERRADLAERFGVTTAPTLVLVVDGRAAGRLEGRASAPMIEALLDEHLAAAAEL